MKNANAKPTNESVIEAAVLQTLTKLLPDVVHQAVYEGLTTLKAPTIKQPKEGGVCRAVWDELDRIAATGVTPTVAVAKDYARQTDLNVNNAKTEFYRWKAYRTITKRSRAKKSAH